MTNSQRLATVRAHFREWLAKNTTSDDQSLEIVSESLVIREEFYCGRSFRAGAFRAVWFIEEDELKIHGVDGTVVAVFRGDEISQTEAADSEDERPDVIKIDAMRPAAVDETSVEKSDRTVAETADDSDDDVRRAA